MKNAPAPTDKALKKVLDFDDSDEEEKLFREEFEQIIAAQIPSEFGALRKLITKFCLRDGHLEIIDLKKVIQMVEAIIYMPYIISRNKNVSEGITDVMND